MGNLVYSKTIIIKDKVIKEEDIHHIARLFKEQYSDDDYERRISLCFDDESMVRGDDIDVFTTDAFKRRRCKSIQFQYASTGYERYLKIDLNNSAIWLSKCEIEVRSTDQAWYESMLKRLETAFDEVENQKKFARNPMVTSTFLSSIEAILMCIAISNLVSVTIKSVATIIFYALIFGVFCLINVVLIDRLEKAYPCIEFSFGPVHLNETLKRRRMIALVVPFVIDVVFFAIGLLV